LADQLDCKVWLPASIIFRLALRCFLGTTSRMLVLGSGDHFGHLDELTQSRLELPHTLIRVVHYDLICFSAHSIRLPRN
jgi:hypothetical protein